MAEAQTVEEKDIKVVEIDGKPVEYVEVDYPGKVEVGQIWRFPGIGEVELVSSIDTFFIDSSVTLAASGSYIEIMGNFIGIAVEPVNTTTKEESMNKQAPTKITSISELNSISLKKPSNVEAGQKWLVDGQVEVIGDVWTRTGTGQVCIVGRDYYREYTASYILSCDYLGMESSSTNPLPETIDMVKSPNHYMLFPEHNLEAKHIVKRVTDNADKANFNMASHEAAWVVQAMQYLLRFPGKNGWEDIKKAKEALSVAIEGYDERMEKEASKDS